MGKKPAAMAPSRMITTEITHARTGRSMKKRASMIILRSERRVVSPRIAIRGLGLVPSLCAWHLCQPRFDDDAGPHLLQAVDDDAFARLQAVFNHTQAVVQRPQADGAGDDLVLVVD